MGSTESPGIMKSKVLCVVFSLFGLFALSSAFYGKQLKPLYPFNGGESFETTPFAPANDQAWINMMWWKSLAGKPVESAMGPVDPYNTDEFSFNNFLLDALKETDPAKKIAGITPGAYQKWTQYSNPAADYIGYSLFSNPMGIESDLPAMGSTLFQPGNDLFWLLQWLQGKTRSSGGAIDNSLLKQYSYLLNSQEPYSVDPYANYWAFSNSDPAPSSRRRRSAEEEEEDNKAVEASVNANMKTGDEAADAIAADEEEERALGERAAAVGRAPAVSEAVEPEVVDYRVWYEETYLPWYEEFERQQEVYEYELMMYEVAQMRQLVPSNPFGDVSFGNPYPLYSKASYMQSLFDSVSGGAAPETTYNSQFVEWKKNVCEKDQATKGSPQTGERCWDASNLKCGSFDGTICNV